MGQRALANCRPVITLLPSLNGDAFDDVLVVELDVGVVEVVLDVEVVELGEVEVVVVDVVVGAEHAFTEARAAAAFTNPAPTSLTPNDPTVLAVLFNATSTCAGVRQPAFCNRSAATAAACGAEAEVPKNRRTPS